ncbi:MAG: hypothetical protein AAGD07_17045 [Planctomycetota bacterium]
MMGQLDVTYRLLKNSPSTTATSVLAHGVEFGKPEVVHRSLVAMAGRDDASASEWLVANWPDHGDQHWRDTLSQYPGKFPNHLSLCLREALREAAHSRSSSAPLDRNPQHLLALVEKVGDPRPSSVLIDWMTSETVSDAKVTELASTTLIRLCEALGQECRAGYELSADDRAQERHGRLDLPERRRLRDELLHRLSREVESGSKHNHEAVIDAFLVIADWNDRDLRKHLDESAPQVKPITRRLRRSDNPAVMQLLAGFLRRRKPPMHILQLVLQRHDPGFRAPLLAAISPTPGPVTLNNLAEYGLPEALRGTDMESLNDVTSADQAASRAAAQAAALPQSMESLQLVLATLERHGESIRPALEQTLAQMPVPPFESWARAATECVSHPSRVNEPPVGDDDSANGNNGLESHQSPGWALHQLIGLLDHESVSLRRAALRLLSSINAKTILGQYDSLDDREVKATTRVALQVDPNTMDSIRDGLRHAVMERRVAAISMAGELAMAEMLADSLENIANEDHQAVRVHLAGVLKGCSGPRSSALLQEMTLSDSARVRDAAVAAMAYKTGGQPSKSADAEDMTEEQAGTRE